MKLKPHIVAGLTVAFTAFLAFSATAFAATAVAPADGGLLDLLRPVWDAFHTGHYVAAGALAVVVFVALLKKYSGDKNAVGKFISSKIGATVMVLVGSFAGTIAAATANASWQWSMLETAFTVAAAAAGGYTILKDLVVDPLVKSAWYQNKAPAWLKAGMGLVLWIFDSSASNKAAVQTAEKAGADAVAAAPSQGVSDAIGKPTEIK